MMRSSIAIATALCLLLTILFSLPPYAAAQRQAGLVNVNVSDIETGDILSDITVSIGVAANIAANICGLTVGVIARDLAHGNDFTCSTAEQLVEITQ
jgi:hypothetical protein